MWIALVVISVLAAAAVLASRLAMSGQRTPHPDDRDRQHEVPGAHDDGPPPPGTRPPAPPPG
jgi:hypothetical protein